MKPVAEISPVLVGEEFRGRHQHSLQATARRARRRRRRDQRLAATDVALQETQHGAPGAQIRVDLAEGAQLRFRKVKRQCGNEALGKALRISDRPGGIRLHGALQNF